MRRQAKRLSRAGRGAHMFIAGLHSGAHPIVANIVPVRRCNLSCSYCNQFDSTSEPVPTWVMTRRIQRLLELRSPVITFTGGEPLLHPDLPLLVAQVRRGGALCTANTNGYLLTLRRIQELNDAGLDYLLISVDNVEPDDASKKS